MVTEELNAVTAELLQLLVSWQASAMSADPGGEPSAHRRVVFGMRYVAPTSAGFSCPMGSSSILAKELLFLTVFKSCRLSSAACEVWLPGPVAMY